MSNDFKSGERVEGFYIAKGASVRTEGVYDGPDGFGGHQIEGEMGTIYNCYRVNRIPEEQKPEPSVPLKDVRAMLKAILDKRYWNDLEFVVARHDITSIAKKHFGVDLE